MSDAHLIRKILTLVASSDLTEEGAHQLIQALDGRASAPSAAAAGDAAGGNAVAIIGMAARMPGAANVREFWDVLVSGSDCVRPLPAARRADAEAHYRGWDETAFLPGERFPEAAYLDEIDKFDADYFGIPDVEADVMDPAHRMFLEVGIEALEDAGYASHGLRGSRTGIFTGNPGHNYAEAVLAEPSALAVTGNLPEFLAARLAFLLDLRGPVFGVQSTCSASLVAVHQACMSLRTGQCELALAGGATVSSFPGNVRTSPVAASGIVSERRRSRPFARGADGLGRGEGVVVFVLKALPAALADRDPIHAIIRGGALNNDGRSAGLTAPNPLAQAALLREAWQDAGIDPRHLSYIEAHGTGTRLGDPIEVRGLVEAFRTHTSHRQFCGIGSVKGNIGHLVDGAAGASGLLKLVLMLERGALVPTLHFDAPNDEIDFVDSPLYVVDRVQPLARSEQPALMGVSSFGFNGTNCHLVVQAAPAVAPARERVQRAYPLFFSARSAEALRAVVARHHATLADGAERSLGDVAFTLAAGRDHHRVRLAIVARSLDEAEAALRQVLADETFRSRPESGIYASASALPAPVPAADSDAHAAARDYVAGGEAALELFSGEERRISLPTYPFRRDRHWFDASQGTSAAIALVAPSHTPAAATDAVLAEIWRSVLGSGAGDDFFAAGGDSLRATMIVSRVRSRCGVDIPLRALFEAPTLSGLHRSVTAALARIQPARVTIPRQARDAPLPLSHAQERLWFLEQLNAQTPAYNMSNAVRMSGAIDAGSLRSALEALLRRHEALRTVFQVVDGVPLQVVRPAEPIELPIFDISALDTAERDARLWQLLHEDAKRSFDLTRGPLFRCALIRLADTEHVLVFSTHHIVSDGWSLGVIAREIGALYAQHRGLGQAALPELRIQYGDYAVWQRERLKSGLLEAQLAYWVRALRDAPPFLELPSERPRPAVQSFRGAVRAIEVDEQCTRRVRELAQREQVTPFIVLLAAFETLLFRYSGQADLVVGSPVANRHFEETEGLIGYIANTLALRTRLRPERGFRDLLREVRDTVLQAQAHQDLPFELLVAQLRPERDLSRQPLFQVNFQLEKIAVEPLAYPGLTLSPFEIDNETAKFDLTLALTEQPDRFAGHFEYCTDLFDAAAMERMARHWLALLRAALADVEQPLLRLPFLADDEVEWLTRGVNATHVGYDPSRGFHELFAEQVRLRPNAIAACHGTERLTYLELDRRANRLGWRLRALGVGPDRPVGVHCGRSLASVVAILGILKAGGAYVPLDPRHPLERRRLVVQDAGLRWIVADAEPGALGVEVTVIDVRDTGSDTHGASDDAPPNAASSDSLAYVLYTSGSTGRPKGVAVQHHALANYVRWAIQAYEMTADAVSVVHSALTFDLTITSLLCPLAAGGTVKLVADDDGIRPLARALTDASERVTLVKLTPTHLALLRDELSSEDVAAIRATFVIGGEALSYEDVAFLQTSAPRARLFNEYGPTETVVGCCVHEVRGQPPFGSAVPIGRPIANAQLYVLDGEGNLVPPGVAGELHIGGSGLARGYLGDPSSTSRAFVPSAFDATPGARLYRTGDRCRRLADGTLEFLGRADAQVKLHGHRLELGEVEETIKRHPAVASAACAVQSVAPGDDRLVAFFSVRPASAELEQRAALAGEKLAHWAEVFERTYGEAETPRDREFQIAGWTSSDTRMPIPDAEMREWLEQTVAQISSLRPQRALEIGCGTGMILSRIARGCHTYVGRDFAAAALQYVQRELLARAPHLSHVELQRGDAQAFTAADRRRYDTVILNSVAQYFPSSDYLLEVLLKAVDSVDRGAVFVGDVRSLPLLGPFHAWVQRQHAPTRVFASELRSIVHRRMYEEEELVVSPAFFHALAERCPRISNVEIRPKWGHADNELTNFRYDVVIHVADASPERSGEALRWEIWEPAAPAAEVVASLLERAAGGAIGLSNIRNARVARHVDSWRRLLSREEGAESAVSRHLAEPAGAAIDPEALRAEAHRRGYDVRLSWGAAHPDGAFDAAFWPRAEPCPLVSWPRPAASTEPLTNDPERGQRSRRLSAELRRFLQDQLPAHAVPAAFVALDELPKTSHGKIDRKALPSVDPRQAARRQPHAAPLSDSERLMVRVWGEVLGIDRVGIHDNFFDLGGDSILLLQVLSRLAAGGLKFRTSQLMHHQTIAELAQAATAAEPTQLLAADARVVLTPIQHWFFELGLADNHYFNQAVLLETETAPDEAALRGALSALLDQHEALRFRYRQVAGRWEQRVVEAGGPAPLACFDLTTLPEAARQAALEERIRELHASLDIERGPLLRLATFQLSPEGAGRLFFVIHHLVVDGVSWRVLLEDFQLAYDQLSHRRPVCLPAKTTPFATWSQRLAEYAATPAAEQELSFWLERLATAAEPLPLDHRQGENLESTVETLTFSLGRTQTQHLLRTVPASAGVTINAVLLAALARAVQQWSGQPRLLVAVDGHGREDLFPDIDLSRTVGWLTSMIPVLLDIGEARHNWESLLLVNAQLRALPTNGLGYGVLRYLSRDRAVVDELARLPSPQIAFNYLGQFDSLFTGSALRPARESTDPWHAPSTQRPFLIDVDASVFGGNLQVRWAYSTARHDRETIRRCATSFMSILKEFVARCSSVDSAPRTAIDA